MEKMYHRHVYKNSASSHFRKRLPIKNTLTREFYGERCRFEREALPHTAYGWIDHDKSKVGYEIPFNRHFYVFKPPRELAEIDAELKGVTDRILKMIGGLSK
jgi:hypothetical protein